MSGTRRYPLVNRLLRDCLGSSLVEFTVVFPIFILIAFGTVDVAYMLFDWASANKATYMGAHRAIVSNPVAIETTNLAYDPTRIGELCVNVSDGTASGACPSVPPDGATSPSVDCIPSPGSGGTCTNGYRFDDTEFTCTIFDPKKCDNSSKMIGMVDIFPRLQRQNVKISYQTGGASGNNLGFAGRPDGLPMNVTVSIINMTHQLYFLGPIMRFFGGDFAANPPIPAFASTLISEDMVTN
jgi:hypothetical protein